MKRLRLMEFGIVLLVLTSAGSWQALAQVNDRTIISKDDPRSPVKIISVRTKEGKLNRIGLLLTMTIGSKT